MKYIIKINKTIKKNINEFNNFINDFAKYQLKK